MKRNIYVCKGLLVKDVKSDKVGRVVTSTAKFAVLRDERGYWTRECNHLEVASYKEVE